MSERSPRDGVPGQPENRRVHSSAMAATRPGDTWTADSADSDTDEIPADRRRPGHAGLYRTTVRKVDPWSVLKLSLIFYFCVLLVVMLGLTVFWAAINRLGVIERLLEFMADLQLTVTVDGGMIGRAFFLLGLLNVILWSGINVFLAFLYNLIADLVGGLRVTVTDED